MAESRLDRLMALGHVVVHTQDDHGNPVSIIAGGYMISSTEDTTTIVCRNTDTAVEFPRDMVDLLIDLLGTHSLSNEDDEYDDYSDPDDDDDEEYDDQEAEE
jgi:hypothetical protein